VIDQESVAGSLLLDVLSSADMEPELLTDPLPPGAPYDGVRAGAAVREVVSPSHPEGGGAHLCGGTVLAAVSVT
jgi:hypothetical protein